MVKNNMEETHNITRTYYYDFSDSTGPVPDHENMIAFLIDESILFAGNDYGSGTVTLYININDFFHPASDAEPLPLNDVPKLFDLYKTKGYDGVAEYVAFKRGIENVRWRDKLKDSNESDNLKKKYSEFNVGPFQLQQTKPTC